MHTHTDIPKTSPDQSRPAPQTLPGPQRRPVQPLVRKHWSDANTNQLALLPVLLGNEGSSAAGSCSPLILQCSLTPFWKNLHRLHLHPEPAEVPGGSWDPPHSLPAVVEVVPLPGCWSFHTCVRSRAPSCSCGLQPPAATIHLNAGFVPLER